MKRKTRSDKGAKVSFEEFAIGWTRQEAGWYTHPELGGILLEPNGWHYYYLMSDHGPFETLREAQEAAVELMKGRAK